MKHILLQNSKRSVLNKSHLLINLTTLPAVWLHKQRYFLLTRMLMVDLGSLLPSDTRGHILTEAHLEALSCQTNLAHWVENPLSPPPQNHASQSEHKLLAPSLSPLLPSSSHVPEIWPILLGNKPMETGNSTYSEAS